jgi:NAD-dependent SIR2 family protein deacetylase
LLDMCRDKKQDAFVYTSNIDGHWHRVFDDDKIVEVSECHQQQPQNNIISKVHGSINYLQCAQLSSECGDGCKQLIWDAGDAMTKGGAE